MDFNIEISVIFYVGLHVSKLIFDIFHIFIVNVMQRLLGCNIVVRSWAQSCSELKRNFAQAESFCHLGMLETDCVLRSASNRVLILAQECRGKMVQNRTGIIDLQNKNNILVAKQ